MLRANHPFIIKMYATFQDDDRVYFILDYCPGGELFGLLKRNRRLSEDRYKSDYLVFDFMHHKFCLPWNIFTLKK